MKNTCIRDGLIMFLFLTLFVSQGCGTTRNVMFGAPSNFDPEHSIVRSEHEGIHNIAVRNDLLNDQSNTHDVQAADVFITPHSAMVYGGIMYDYNWIVWDEHDPVPVNMITAVFGLLDTPLSLVGDTITAPFILLFSDRYIGA